MGNRIYGCDDCLAVCPWNKFARATREAKLKARDDLAAPPLAELAALDDAAFRAKFSGSPIKRIGRDRFLRNVLIAIGNSGSADLAAVAEAHLADPAPLVRGAAVWALSRLLPAKEFAALKASTCRPNPMPTCAMNGRRHERRHLLQGPGRMAGVAGKNHATASEQWVGFYKAGTDKKGITYKQALDEALCFGWIDAVRRGGHATWSIRFTPRKKGSIWSAVNIRRIEELKARARSRPPGSPPMRAAIPRSRRNTPSRIATWFWPRNTSSASAPTKPPGRGSKPCRAPIATRPSGG